MPHHTGSIRFHTIFHYITHQYHSIMLIPRPILPVYRHQSYAITILILFAALNILFAATIIMPSYQLHRLRRFIIYTPPFVYYMVSSDIYYLIRHITSWRFTIATIRLLLSLLWFSPILYAKMRHFWLHLWWWAFAMSAHRRCRAWWYARRRTTLPPMMLLFLLIRRDARRHYCWWCHATTIQNFCHAHMPSAAHIYAPRCLLYYYQPCCLFHYAIMLHIIIPLAIIIISTCSRQLLSLLLVCRSCCQLVWTVTAIIAHYYQPSRHYVWLPPTNTCFIIFTEYQLPLSPVLILLIVDSVELTIILPAAAWYLRALRHATLVAATITGITPDYAAWRFTSYHFTTMINVGISLIIDEHHHHIIVTNYQFTPPPSTVSLIFITLAQQLFRCQWWHHHFDYTLSACFVTPSSFIIIIISLLTRFAIIFNYYYYTMPTPCYYYY